MPLRFFPTDFADAWIVESEPFRDERGSFERNFCAADFGEHGLEYSFVQVSTSYTHRRGTIRGLHYQRAPHEEVKVVRCVQGEVFDVIVDLRPGSPTYKHWQGFHLSAANRRQIYVPKGFAHGLQTLTDDVAVNYMISAFYAPEAASGVRYDDPAFAISWPLPVALASERDQSWPYLA